ncbi:WXG100 family type VII secretion target [Streptomyces sioyaensis]|uniref:WXG100 family type VII secretion target n=1 Tax=Streptomyces sioyaensis TaxID=67364 RepID=UPI0037890082
MAAGHFQAHPEELRELAKDFQTAADELAGRIASFQGSVVEIGEAFGLLGACTGVTGQYMEMVNHTSEGLTELANLLYANSSGIQQSAGNYEGIDQHISATMGA